MVYFIIVMFFLVVEIFDKINFFCIWSLFMEYLFFFGMM